MTTRISPKCLNGYDIICAGHGRIERNEEGVRQNIPEPFLSNCSESEGLCWWVRPIGFSFSLTLQVSTLNRFWKGGSSE